MDAPTNLLDAIRYFTNPENCRAFMMDLRWPDGKVACPRCNSEHVVYLAKARVWKCYAKHPSPTFSLKTGTVFEDSPLGLDKWLAAVWLVVNCKNGISSYEMARDLDVTQKSAWFMNHRIRRALHAGSFDKLTGHVEADETFIGGKARNMHASKRRKLGISQSKSLVGKVAVMGLLERHNKDEGGAKVRTMVIANRKKHQLEQTITEHVETGSHLYTDALRSYDRMSQRDFVHKVIDHAENYVDGAVHTNGLENYWSLLKRALKGTYVSVEPFHLFRYLDEQAFRFNNRKGVTDFDRFKLATTQIVGRRLTYADLIGESRIPESIH
jgi:transposase-like protein